MPITPTKKNIYFFLIFKNIFLFFKPYPFSQLVASTQRLLEFKKNIPAHIEQVELLIQLAQF